MKTGSGTLILAGTANTYTGRTTISGGTLVALGQSYTAPGPATGSLGSGPITLSNSTLVLAGSTAATTYDLISGNALTLAGNSNSIVAGSLLAGVANGTVTVSGTGTLPIAAGQTLNLGTTNGYTLGFAPSLQFNNSGTLSVTMGSVGLGATNLAASSGTFTAVSGGTLGLAGMVGSGTFAPQSTGTVVLSGTYAGPLANLVPASGGVLVMNGNSTSGTLSIAGGGYYAASAGAFGPATLALSGGSLGATTPLTGSNAVPFGPGLGQQSHAEHQRHCGLATEQSAGPE